MLSNRTLRSIAIPALVILLISLTAAIAFDAGPSGKDGTLEEQLGEALGLEVRPNSVRWSNPPSEGLAGAVGANELFFLACEKGQENADLYRAMARMAPQGRLVGAEGLRNLTTSSAGDDYSIAKKGPFIAVATRALGRVRSVTVFDVDGQILTDQESWTRTSKFLARITDLQRTGRYRGLGRVNVRFDKPAEELDLVFTGEKEPSLVLEWTDSEGNRKLASLDPRTGATTSETLSAAAEVRLPKRPVLWMVDTVRSVPWIGPGPIEWAEGRFFALKDKYRRFMYDLQGDEEWEEDEGGAKATAPLKISYAVEEGLEVGDWSGDESWPPPPIEPPVFKRKRKGEGTWQPDEPDFVKDFEDAPPLIYRTYVRSDIRRPYVRVELMAMDTRRLDMHMVAGHEDPQSTTGATGTGRIPREAEILENFVLAFNGAFKTEHGAYGMMVDKNVLLPPKDEAATVAVYDDGKIAMGSWPKDKEIPENMSSYRQNIDPLVENGKVNPRRRYLWGFTLSEDIKDMNTIRSGLCINDAGHLIYAWGEDLTATSMGIAMNAAGCTYGMHLDMNPFHTAFIYYRFKDVAETIEKKSRPKFESKVAMREMRYSANRYVNGAPKDFFFMTLKNPTPTGKGWTSEGITQSAPAFLPNVYKRTTDDAVIFALRDTAASISHGVSLEEGAPMPKTDDHLLLSEVVLGPWSSTRGEMKASEVMAGMVRDAPTLTVDQEGNLQVIPWDDSRRPADAVQGTWMVRDKEAVFGEGETAAIGITNDGWTFICEGEWTRVGAELLELGVENAVAFPSSKSAVMVRGAKGMMTADGSVVSEKDPLMTTLRLDAKPRNLVGKRL